MIFNSEQDRPRRQQLRHERLGFGSGGRGGLTKPDAEGVVSRRPHGTSGWLVSQPGKSCKEAVKKRRRNGGTEDQ